MRLAAGSSVISLSTLLPQKIDTKSKSDGAVGNRWITTRGFFALFLPFENPYVIQIHLRTVKAKWPQQKKLTSQTQLTQFDTFNSSSKEGALRLGRLLIKSAFPHPQTWVQRTASLSGHALSSWIGLRADLNSQGSKAPETTQKESQVAASINSWKDAKNGG